MPAEVIAEARRGWMRIISLPEAEARRKFMQVRCLSVLQERLPGLDVDFAVGIRSKDVAWRAAPMDGNLLICSCGVEVTPCSSMKLPCVQCRSVLPKAISYKCQQCRAVFCAACAGRGRAIADWRGREVAIDMELWDAPNSEESAKMLEKWEQDQHFGPDDFRNTFKYYNKGHDFTKQMSHGFVGSHLAHYDCWRRAVEAQTSTVGFQNESYDNGPEWLLVVEDDAVPLPEFELDWGDVLALLCLEIAALRRSKTPWDLIWVGRCAAMGP